jgi:hypothetical protein
MFGCMLRHRKMPSLVRPAFSITRGVWNPRADCRALKLCAHIGGSAAYCRNSQIAPRTRRAVHPNVIAAMPVIPTAVIETLITLPRRWVDSSRCSAAVTALGAPSMSDIVCPLSGREVAARVRPPPI